MGDMAWIVNLLAVKLCESSGRYKRWYASSEDLGGKLPGLGKG
jgi:hypothetical protein